MMIVVILGTSFFIFIPVTDLQRIVPKATQILSLPQPLFFGCNMYRDNAGIYMEAHDVGNMHFPREQRPELDDESFVIINKAYSKDKNHVYLNCTADRIVVGADSATFAPYDIKKDVRLGRDKTNVYYNDYVVEGADPDTYIEITSSFDKDKNNVYFIGRKIEGADPETYVPLSYSCGRDQWAIYCEQKRISSIDAETFTQIDAKSWHDKDHYYCMLYSDIQVKEKDCSISQY